MFWVNCLLFLLFRSILFLIEIIILLLFISVRFFGLYFLHLWCAENVQLCINIFVQFLTIKSFGTLFILIMIDFICLRSWWLISTSTPIANFLLCFLHFYTGFIELTRKLIIGQVKLLRLNLTSMHLWSQTIMNRTLELF